MDSGCECAAAGGSIDDIKADCSSAACGCNSVDAACACYRSDSEAYPRGIFAADGVVAVCGIGRSVDSERAGSANSYARRHGEDYRRSRADSDGESGIMGVSARACVCESESSVAFGCGGCCCYGVIAAVAGNTSELGGICCCGVAAGYGVDPVSGIASEADGAGVPCAYF